MAELFFGCPYSLGDARGVVQGEHFLQLEGGPAAEGVAASQQEHAVGSGLIDGSSSAAFDLLGEFCRGLTYTFPSGEEPVRAPTACHASMKFPES